MRVRGRGISAIAIAGMLLAGLTPVLLAVRPAGAGPRPSTRKKVAPDPTTATDPEAAAKSIAWRRDRDAAMDEARRDGRPILIDFWATWCVPCREMEAQLWSRADVLEVSRKFVCLRVDIDNDPVTANRYRTEAVPTVILADPWGTELARREGFSQPAMYVDLLKAVPSDYHEVAPWQTRLLENPRDVEAMRQAGLAYHRLMLFDTSNDFLDKVADSKEARANPNMLAEALTVEGWNHLKLRRVDRARKAFEKCLKAVPEHPALDVTLYGLLAVNLADGDRKKAEPILVQLETCCAASPMTARARRDLGVPQPPKN